jgi:undecaprenyl-diphosphatase
MPHESPRPGPNPMMRYVTHLGGARTTIVSGLGLAIFGQSERPVGVALLAASGVTQIAVQALKRLVGRRRPCDRAGRPLARISVPDPFSFPSGHSATATALASTLAFAYPWITPMVLPAAVLVAVSRVSLGAHHVTDVVAGAAIGVGSALIVRSMLP